MQHTNSLLLMCSNLYFINILEDSFAKESLAHSFGQLLVIFTEL